MLLRACGADSFVQVPPSRGRLRDLGRSSFDRRRRIRTAMKFSDISIDFFENTSSEPAFLHGIIRLNAGARIVKSTIRGPLFLNKNSQIGAEFCTGKYSVLA